MKKNMIISIIIAIALILSGCWDKREINELAFVQGIIIEKGQNDNIKLTLHILKPAVLAQSKGGGDGGGMGGGGGGNVKPYLIMSEEAPTISKALSKFNHDLSRELFIQQNEILLISEKLARSGLKDILDALTRKNEFRRTSYLLMLKGDPEDIVNLPASIEKNPYSDILGAVKRSAKTSTACVVNVNDFFKALTGGEGIQPVMGVLNILKKNGKPMGISVKDAAIFDKDKFIGYTNPIETSGLLFINNKVQNGTIEVEQKLQGRNSKIAFGIIRSNTEVKPVIKNNKLYMDIFVKVETVLDEQESNVDFSNPKMLDKLEQLENDAIKYRIEQALNKIQKDYKVDAFGFGENIHKHYPALWKKIKNNWKNLFPYLTVEIKVNSWLARTGITTKPPKF